MKHLSQIPLLTTLSLLSSLVFSAPVPQECTCPPDGGGNPDPPSSGLPVGSWISSCTVPGTVALTFDDGPIFRTASVLDQLQSAGMSATFFVNGINWGNINSAQSQALVRRMLAEGHQIGHHTWSHPDLTTISQSAVVSEMTQLEDALDAIIGKHPTYMRPPYFGTNQAVLDTLGDLNYHVFRADIDTMDWANQSPSEIGRSVQNFKNGLDAGGSLVLAHDTYQYTADVLVGEMIAEVQARGLNAVTLGECLGDPSENWYRT